jgi:hypothetical protein
MYRDDISIPTDRSIPLLPGARPRRYIPIKIMNRNGTGASGAIGAISLLFVVVLVLGITPGARRAMRA